MTPTDEPAPPLAISLLGPFCLQVNGAPVRRLGAWRQQEAILALLVLRHPHPAERASLAGWLWPEAAESQGRATLRRYLTDLRRALGPAAARLQSPSPSALALDLTGAVVDLLAFDAALARGDERSLQEAVALYRGPLLEGWIAEWVFQERQSREQAFLGALEALAAGAMAGGQPATAEGCLRRAVGVDPLRESAQRALMQVLAAGGNYAAALHCYRELRLHLHRELNTEPDAETQALFQRLRSDARRLAARGPGGGEGAKGRRGEHEHEHDAGHAGSPRRPVPPSPPRPSSLGRYSPQTGGRTPLIGRAEAVAAACDLLLRGEAGLLTLTGAPGIGKTRLGLEVAARLLSEFEDGVFLVDLAPLRDPAHVPSAIAVPLGVREAPGILLADSLKAYLWEKHLLLFLDNFEHLLPAAAVAADLLAGCPHLKLLVTSRARLHLRGEQEFSVPPLALPPVVGSGEWGVESPTEPGSADLSTLPQYAAVELFIQRAREIRPDFALTPGNAAAVAAICVRLEGLPLAIELAASRIKLLSPPALLRRLEHRLTLLTGGARDLPERQQTLRDAIAWSYDLLGEAEQRLFRRLSVFAGGCTLEAAEAVCGAVDSGQWIVDSPAGAEPRGEPVLSKLTTNHQPLSTDFLDGLASLVEQNLLRQTERTDGEPRFSMLETILEYGRERLAESGEEAAVREQHARFFVTQAEVTEPQLWGPRSAEWTERWEAELNNLRDVLAWAVEQREAALGLRLLVALEWFWKNGLHERLAYEAVTKLLAFPEAAERSSLRGWALMVAGHLRPALMPDYEGTRQLLEESRALGEEVGDRRLIVRVLAYHGRVTTDRGDPCTGASLFTQSLAIAREVNDPGMIWGMLWNLAAWAARHGDFGTARAHLEERLALVQAAGSPIHVGNTLVALGGLAHEEGDTASARSLYEQSLAILRETGIAFNLVRALHGLGDVALDEGEPEQALALHEECLALRKKLNIKSDLATSLARLGRIAEVMGKQEKARALYTETLHLWREMGNREGIAGSLEGMARLGILEGEPERAARLFGAAAALREAAGAPLSPSKRQEVEPGLTAARAALSDAAFQTEWAKGQAMSLEQMIHEGLERGTRAA